MDAENASVLAVILRSTLDLVKHYADADAREPEFDELTTALERAIAVIDAKGDTARRLPPREDTGPTRNEKSA